MSRCSIAVQIAMLAVLAGCNPDKDGDGVKARDDCNDADASAFPGNPERCGDNIDNDCDGLADEEDAVDALDWYADADADSYGDAAVSVPACEQPTGYVGNDDDCDDADASLNPDTEWYADTDDDGYGDPDNIVNGCLQPAGAVANEADCDDGDGAINPDATEVCDGDDNDCDGAIDEDDATDAPTWYADTDADDFGDPESTTRACDQPAGYVANDLDCDDGDEVVLACCSSDAPDGDLIVTADTSIEGGVWWFGTVQVAEGATLTVTGNHPLVIYANEVDISGTLDLSGGDGLDSSSSSIPDGGDAVAGGGGGGGGGDCGNGAGAGGYPNGGDALSYADAGAGGLPYALHNGTAAATGGGFGPGGGGGGGGSADAGADGDRVGSGDGVGGEAFGSEDFSTGLFGGSGGAGGGANGGGGGGGGGAVAIYANWIFVPGTVDASGGEGGGKTSGSCTSGGGGGGGGGSIWLHADIVDVSGVLDTSGGAGHLVDSSYSLNAAGGDGSDGRIRISGIEVDVSGLVLSSTSFGDEAYPECVVDDDTVYDVQDGTIGIDTPVIVREVVVTGATSSGFYAQEPGGGQHSGVWVYTSSGMPLGLEVGDVVSIWGTTTEYFELTEILADYVLWHGPGSPLGPEVLTTSALAADPEPWEGVLVQVSGVTVVEPDLGFGEFALDNGIVVDDQLYRWSNDFTLSAGDGFTSVTGPLNYSFSAFKLEPRSVADLAGYTSGS